MICTTSTCIFTPNGTEGVVCEALLGERLRHRTDSAIWHHGDLDLLASLGFTGFIMYIR